MRFPYWLRRNLKHLFLPHLPSCISALRRAFKDYFYASHLAAFLGRARPLGNDPYFEGGWGEGNIQQPKDLLKMLMEAIVEAPEHTRLIQRIDYLRFYDSPYVWVKPDGDNAVLIPLTDKTTWRIRVEKVQSER